MSKGINKAILVGNLGADPETRELPTGGTVTNIRIATAEQWKDKTTGEKRESTEWHRVVMFHRLGEIAAEYLRKGAQVYIEGRIQTRKYTDKSGEDRYATEIVANDMQMLGARVGGGYSSEAGYGSYKGKAKREPAPHPIASQKQPSAGGDEFNDDIPF